MYNILISVITPLLSMVGTLVGTIYGIKKTTSLTIYRIGQLEKKVDNLTELDRRLICCEKSCSSAHKRIDEMRLNK